MRFRRFMLLGTASFSSVAAGQSIVAAPATDQPPVVVAGSATLSTNAAGTVRTVTQTTDRAFLDWSTLNVPQDHTLRFEQPDANSITLNRVTGNSFSVIDGLIEANGQVWILNPNGVFISPTGQITTSGFLASTGNIAHTDFMNATGQFALGGNGSSAFISNQGTITTSLGYTVLNAVSVQNSGQISASRGTVLLASVDNLSLSFDQGQLISYDLSNNSIVPASFREITNLGTISAEGGLVALSMASALGAISGVINVEGLIEANSAQSANGKVTLDAGPNAALRIKGTVTVEGTETGDVGGVIEARGSLVTVETDAILNADGKAGGGEITLAANPAAQTAVDFSSLEFLPGSSVTTPPSATSIAQSLLQQREVLVNGALASVAVQQGSVLSASATELGRGGFILVDANDSLGLSAKVSGLLRANGAGPTGDGGEIALGGFHLDISGATLEAVAGSPTASPGNVELTAASIDLVDQLTPAGSDVLAWQPSATNLPFYDPAELQSLDILDLQVAQAVPIGFDFLYFGETFDSVEVSYAGLLTFGTLNGNSLCCNGLPLAEIAVPPSIFGLWTDLGIEFDPGSSVPNVPSGKPRFGTFDLGNGLKEFVLQWDNVPEFFNRGTGNNFEIRIRSDGSILLNYGDLDVTSHSVTAGLTGRTINDISQLFFRDLNPNNTLADISQTSAIFRQANPVSQISKQSIEDILIGGSNVSINAKDFTDDNSRNLSIGNVTISGSSTFGLPSGGAAQQFLVTADKDIRIVGDQIFAGPLAVRMAADVNGDAIGGAIRAGGLLEAGLAKIVGDLVISGLTEIRAPGDIIILGDIRTAPESADSLLILDTQGALKVSGPIGDTSTVFAELRSGSLDVQSIRADQVNIDLFAEGSIAGPITTGALLKFGPGTLTLAGDNGDLNEIAVRGGRILAQGADNIGTGTILLDNGELNFTGQSPVELLNSIIVTQSGSISFAGSGTIAGQVDRSGSVNAEFDVKAGGDLTFAGEIGTNSALGGIFGTAEGRIILDAGARLVASDIIEMFGFAGFTNLSPRADVLSSAEWFIWSGNPDPFGGSNPDNTGALQHDWRFYGISEAEVRGDASPPERPVGAFGLGYRIAPVLTPRLGASLSKIYDGTREFSTESISLDFDGLLEGDSLNASSITSALADVAGVSASQATISGIEASFTDASGKPVFGYQFNSTITTPASILPRPLLASLIGAVSRNYDGTTDALLTSGNFALDGLVSGETITVTQTAGAFATPNVGNDLSISAILASADFTAGEGTNLGNYLLPTSASGAIGTILPRPLLASLIGAVSRNYDGTTDALLTSGNFALDGLVSGETITVTQTAGAFATPNVGNDLSISAILASADFTAGEGTNLGNYLLPTSASGAIGTILPRPLLASLIGAVSRNYDGTTDALLTSGNFALDGLVSGETITVTQTAGAFATPNVGNDLSISAILASADFTAGEGTNLGNYLLPTSASGAIGTILPRPLLASLIGAVSRNYDGTTDALLTSGNFALDGLVSGETITVTQTAGAFATPNVGNDLSISAILASADFTAGEGTNLGNYLLPTSASGAIGTILPRPLLASLIGAVSRNYDGTTDALLTSGNFALDGLVSGETITVTQTAGAFATPNVGNDLSISAILASADFTAGEGTNLGNYLLPTSASGAIGTILPRPLLASLIGAVSRNYDGTTDALLTSGNFALDGLVSGETITVTQTAGAFATPNVGNDLSISAILASADFTAGEGTNLGNYLLPTSASGAIGTILPRPLLASLIGAVSRNYDGTTDALLTSGNFALDGLVSGETITVTQTAGAFATPNVGNDLSISAILASADFTAGEGTNLGNYLLPTSASGAIGTILPRPLLASLIGAVSRNYDGTTDALLTSGNFALDGLVSGETITVTQTAGAFATPNVGNDLSISAILASADFTAGEGTNLGNYLLPTSASGAIGTILPRPLLASLIGAVSRNYDGTTDALLTSGNFALDGLVSGETITVTQTAGAFATPNVGNDLSISAILASADFTAGEGTNLGNYLLPTSASGAIGTILPRPLLASLIGAVSRNYDGTTDALLTSGNFALDGLVSGETITVTQTAGAFATPNVGNDLSISAILASADFTAGEGTNLGNYLLPTSASGAIGTILPRPLLASLIGAVSRNYDGTTDALLTSGNFALDGLVSGETITVTQTAGAFATPNVGNDLSISAILASADFTAGEGTNLGNYLLPTSASGAIGTILPRPLLASLIGAVSRNYDGTTDALLTSGNFALDGLVSGETITVTQTAGAFATPNVGNDLSISAILASADFTAGEGTNLGNYLLPTSASGAIGTILPRPLLASLIGAVSRNYDGTTDALLTSGNFALDGLVSGETITVTQTAGAFATPNVGNDLSISAILASADFTAGEGTNLGNYLLPTSASGAIGTILPRPLLASLIGAVSRNYDGTTDALLTSGNFALDGLVSGETITVTQTAGAFATPNVGNDLSISAILASADFTAGEGTNLGNYLLPTSASGAIGTILPRPLLASLIGAVSRNYDGTTDALLTSGNFALDGLVSGETITVTQTAGAFATPNVGNDLSISAILASADFTAGEGTNLGNYLLPTSASGAIGTILPRPLLASLIGAVSRNYDGTTDALLTSGNFALDGLVSGETITVTQTAGAFATPNVGNDLSISAILASADFTAGEGTNLGNYLLPTSASGAIGTILPRPLLASLIGAVSRNYDGTTDALLTSGNFALDGLVSGETITVTQTAGAFATPNVGNDLSISAILASADFTAGEGTNLGNYLLPTSASGAIGTILPRPLLASLIGAVSRNYDGTTDALLTSGNFALDGLVSGETITVTQTAGAFATPNVGNDLSISAILASADFTAGEGTNLGNYLLPTSASGAIGTILPRPLLASLIGAVSRNYDGTTDALLTSGNFALDGLVSGETITVTQTAGAFATPNVGNDLSISAILASADFTAGEGTNLGNYLLPTSASGAIGTILPRPLLASLIGAVSRNYDGTTDALLTSGNFALDGLVSGETITVTQTAGAFATPNVGNDLSISAILASADFTAGEGTNLGNYLLPTSASGAIGTILPRPLLASLIGAVSRNYDGTTDALLTSGNFALDGLVSGETITVTQTAGAFATPNVGNDLSISAILASADFTAGEGTNLGNYLLPTSASGAIGTILPRPLLASLIGAVSRNYDGTTDALLTSGNFALDGLVSGETITVTQTAGAFATPNVGNDLSISAILASADFTAGEGTNLGNYLLPTSASGAIGTILPRPLLASLIGAVSRNYDGTTDALLTSGNFALDGLVSGETITVTQTAGAFATPNVGNDLSISAILASADFTAGEGTNLGNYLLPTSASGAIGTILPRPLLASLIGAVSRNYDGTTDALLTSGNFALDGLVSGETITVTQTAGAFATPNVGNDLSISAILASADFTAGEGTNLGNYLLPTSASGAIGTILPRPLLASLIGAVSRNYDGTTDALLTSGNFALDGLVSGETITVTQTAGAFATPNVGNDLSISAILASADFTAGEGTNLGNYLLPTSASGAIGTILPRPLLASLIGAVSRNYDGTTDALLTSGNFALDGLVSGETITVTQTAGAFATPNVGNDLSISAILASADFTAGEGTNLGNYLLPTSASGAIGTILPRPLLASLIGAVSRNYDGTTDALLTSGNFALDGLVSGETITVTQTAGAFATPNVGNDLSISAILASADFTAGEGTNLGNYLLPTSASGAIGTILPRPLLASLIGAVSRNYDGTTDALLTSGNFALDGLVSGETITVTQTAGAFATPNVGNDLSISAILASADFTAGEGTNLGNYLLPTSASGAIGTILPLTLVYRADPAVRFQGAANPTFTGSVTGFLEGETLASATTGALTFTSPATTESDVGLYPILGSGLFAINYVFVQAPENAQALTIQPNIMNQISNVAQTQGSGTGASGSGPGAGSGSGSGSGPDSGSGSGSNSDAGSGEDQGSGSESGVDSDDTPASSNDDSSSSSDGSEASEGDSGADSSGGSSSADTTSAGSGATDSSDNDTAASSDDSPTADQPVSQQSSPTVVAVEVEPAEPLPPSPVGEDRTPTPSDPEDSSDPVLAAISGDENTEVQTTNVQRDIVQLTPAISVSPQPQARPSPRSTDNALSINSLLNR
ncbi:YDG domain-containing protein [Erythrobacter aurantius]|uniref:YDG domain-containing protein n=1 Tax=Erythrobacter aurantius TaxID=2909249 RepID=UPI00207933D4|nr:YDG domain-containing protein [Erythrobacter aurantius]